MLITDSRRIKRPLSNPTRLSMQRSLASLAQEIFRRHLLLLLFFWLGYMAEMRNHEKPVSSAELPKLAESTPRSSAPSRSAHEIHLYVDKSWRGGVEVIAAIDGIRFAPNALDEWIEYLPQHYRQDQKEVAIYAHAELDMQDIYCLTTELRRHGLLKVRYMHGSTAGLRFR